MNNAAIEQVKPLMDAYIAKGWFLNRIGSGPDSYLIRVKSPRLNFAFIMNEIFDEEGLLIEESRNLAYQNHHAAISRTLGFVANKVINDIANLYLQEARGKTIVIPEEIVVHDLKIALK